MRSSPARLQPSMSIMERNHSTWLRAARSSFQTASKFLSPQVRLVSIVATYHTVHSKLWATRQLNICPSISSTREPFFTILPNRQCHLNWTHSSGGDGLKNMWMKLSAQAMSALSLEADNEYAPHAGGLR